MAQNNASEDLVGQDRKLLAQIMELMPLNKISTGGKQTFIDGKGGAAYWLAWQLRKYDEVATNPQVLLIDRTVKFNPKKFFAPAFDNPYGGEWRVRYEHSSMMQAVPEIATDKIRLNPFPSFDAEGLGLPLNVSILLAFLKQPDRIPKEWQKQVDGKPARILFTATKLLDTYDRECFLALVCLNGNWHWDCFPVNEIAQKTEYSFYSFLEAIYYP